MCFDWVDIGFCFVLVEFGLEWFECWVVEGVIVVEVGEVDFFEFQFVEIVDCFGDCFVYIGQWNLVECVEVVFGLFDGVGIDIVGELCVGDCVGQVMDLCVEFDCGQDLMIVFVVVECFQL